MDEKIRVFLVDDQPIVRHGLSLLLEEQPNISIVGEASDGKEAVEGVLRVRPDVVLMDLDMPGLSGLEATKQITDVAPDISILILTVHDLEDYLVQALQANAKGYLLKGGNVDELVKAVQTVYAGDVFIYPRMATKLVSGYMRRLQPYNEDDGYGKLSNREREVLPMLAENYTNQEVGNKLGLSQYTIQTYRQRIMKKLGLHNKHELLRYALTKDLITLGD